MVNIKVAVRIRPMSVREESQREEIIVKNNEKCILVTNPKVPEKNDSADSRQRIRRFAVDYCYDPAYPHLATQQAVYEELGTEVLGNMFDGYNACVLAYGHSASGKTYTMMGDEENPGLTPRICTGLWQMINNREGMVYTVTVSFLEIYNEKVRDLLVDEDAIPSGFSLRVREHPKLGPYVQGLSEHVVDGEEELLRLLAQGNSKRSTAATESNIYSSRSHAVFTIKFKQIGDQTAKVSKVHLVDLAGSERASAIQSRARLKEGANINKSLVTLGNVISALAECCDPWVKTWQPFVPYRDSVLTWLLKDTLGGNSNTIMIATISPASSCYNDTINTLRYAKRTKRIVNQPIVNEDPKIRTIRELRDEVSRLKTMLLSLTMCHPETVDGTVPVSEEAGSNSKWQGAKATQCAVALQTDDVDLPLTKWTPSTANMDDVVASVCFDQQVISDSCSRINCEEVQRNIATLDILPTFLEVKQASSWDTPTNPVSVHVSEINAENGTGVNRVIAEPERFPEPFRRTESVSRVGLPRVLNRTLFKRRRELFRRPYVNPAWIMLHRSRPDLIKSISARPLDAPSTSSQSFVDASSQSVSENSLISSESAESHQTRPRPQASLNLSRASSIGDASGSSTPTQPQKLVTRKKEVKRAEIVASVTSRLYATKKRPDPRLEALQAAEKDDDDDEELEELKLCKRARMKLFDLSRKLAMAKKAKRTVDSDTQTEVLRSTLRMKEKCVATDQQGVLHVLHSATNTPLDKPLNENTDPPVVMNKVYLPNVGNFVLECGPSLRVAVPSTATYDSASQTKPESRDQTTSPKKIALVIEDGFSDDSLDSETLGEKIKNFSPKFFSCNNLAREFTPMENYKSHQFFSNSIINQLAKDAKTNNSSSQPSFMQKRSIDSLLGKPSVPGVRVERSLQPIARYTISGTNALFEYDPNKYVNDKIVYSSHGDDKIYQPGAFPPILYPQYKQELFNGLPIHSSETISGSDDAINPSKSVQFQVNEDNLSSNTSSASTASSSASDTSSDDFIFIHNDPDASNPRTGHDLYTISENSEPSCSNQSTPLNSRSPRLETLEESRTDDASVNKEQVHTEVQNSESKNVKRPTKESNRNAATAQDSEINKVKRTNKEQKGDLATEPKGSSRKINWSEMQCQSSRRFVNFNFKPAFLSTSKSRDQSSEAHLTSEDSITFVFMGPKQQSTSVLLELIKRSLANESGHTDNQKGPHQSRSRGVQCNSKLMRSVSVDTAMIALSRFARNQRPATDITRTNSLSTLVSEELQVILDQGKLHSAHESSTQCDFSIEENDSARERGVQYNFNDQVSENSESWPLENGCQCNRDKNLHYSSGTITMKDQETVTDPEKREGVTQTDKLEDLFDTVCPELPRRSLHAEMDRKSEANRDNDSREKRWMELKQLVLGTRKDLFPAYLNSEEEGQRKPKKSGKSVSWSDLGEKEDNGGETEENMSSESNSQSRRVRFYEPHETKGQTCSPSPDRQQAVQAISSFITEATTLLRNLHSPNSQISSDSEDSDVKTRKFSSSSLLRRRAKTLPRMKIHCGTQNETTPQIETSVQTDVEKTDRLVQTGGFASSLVGPSVRRSVTPSLRRDYTIEDNSNMTWPRRRMSAKPPTGLKPGSSPRSITPGRSGSLPSSGSITNTNCANPNPTSNSLNSPQWSPLHSRNAPQSDWQVEESCQRLELAINRDRTRQESLSYVMEYGLGLNSNENLQEPEWTKNSTPEENSLRSTFEYVNYQKGNLKDGFQPAVRPRTPNSIRRSSIDSEEGSLRISDIILSRTSSTSRRPFRDISPTQNTNYTPQSTSYDSLKRETKRSYGNFSQKPSPSLYRCSSSRQPYVQKSSLRIQDSGIRTPEYCMRPIRTSYDVISDLRRESLNSRSNMEIIRDKESVPTSNNEDLTSLQAVQQRTSQYDVKSYTSLRPSFYRQKTCRCACHNTNFSCSELESKSGESQCHSCCVPCLGDRERPYHSEPALSFSDFDWKTAYNTKYTPSAHLRYLVALRRGIVAEHNHKVSGLSISERQT